MTTTAEAPGKPKNIEYFYRVKLAGGKTESGKASYPSRAALIAKLTRMDGYESIIEVRESGLPTVGKKARPKQRSLVAASRQLSLCLEVGMDDRASIDAVAGGGEIEDPVLAYGLAQVSKDMGAEGMKMSEAMAQYPYIFPQLMTETLHAGEEGGFVAKAAAQAADDLEAADDQRAKLKKAMTYPMVILVLSAAIFVFMMMYVVPKFGGLYDELSGGTAELPKITQMVMAASDQMIWAVPTVVITGIIAGIWYRRNSQEQKVREFIDPLKFKLPIFGGLFRKIALAKFCSVLASLTENRVHEIQALTITAGSVGNVAMEKAILAARDGKLRGESIVEPLSKEPLFPKLLIQFMAIAEETGGMAKSLRAVGRLYERDADATTNNMEALIQPIFLIGIAVMVLIIALAVYLPYFSMGDIVSPY
ncbi:type II secretion system F family protein [Arthrobacter caoxuetaonis]|uniref:Type II secretion system F family protein n=1 Tax=Arthrobacter caoxuetaonis TaxID=2886935 RepID=A0A9X1MI11_9MICC|nr:type II secretion system F family protein [Arthrobacter caoxuetaonis]MCC3299257.1 type II secretion system F family protein [Arthrobacter caoxuetaonis]USQ59249.1 type II secretion system F family protein [Arthrobacter caoxuetaonis]